MIRRQRRNPPHRAQPPSRMPYDMFEQARSAREAHSAGILAGVYHKGQDRVWDGQAVLQELVARHGGVQIAPQQLAPLSRIFATIFWGELAAWKVSAELALEIEPLEAKMAATAQAHDEARHFYVLHDYLQLLDYTPGPLPAASAAMLQEVLQADNLAKKLMGMQLMVEPTALTLFHLFRAHPVEPVLADLLAYYERDEARHVALGVHYLPGMIKQMRPHELLELWAWQLKMMRLQCQGLAAMEEDVRALGFSPQDVYQLGEQKQLGAAKEMEALIGGKLPITDVMTRMFRAQIAWTFPDPGQGRRARIRGALRAATGPLATAA